MMRYKLVDKGIFSKLKSPFDFVNVAPINESLASCTKSSTDAASIPLLVLRSTTFPYTWFPVLNRTLAAFSDGKGSLSICAVAFRIKKIEVKIKKIYLIEMDRKSV